MFVVSVFIQEQAFFSSVFRSLKMPVLILSDFLYSDSRQLIQRDLAVHADYLHPYIALEQSGVIGLRELPHPVGHGQFVYPVLDTAQRRF